MIASFIDPSIERSIRVFVADDAAAAPAPAPAAAVAAAAAGVSSGVKLSQASTLGELYRCEIERTMIV